MRLVFCGTPQFAVPTLNAILQAGHRVDLVLSQPDRASGRGMEVQISPVKRFAEQHGLALAQPEKIRNNPDLQQRLRAVSPGRDCHRRLWPHHSAVDVGAAEAWKSECSCVAAAEISRSRAHPMGGCEWGNGDRHHHHAH